jgi:hypothetical protein
MAHAWTPAKVARLDQDLAAQNRKLDIMIQWFRERTAAAGQDQALADTALALLSLPPAEGLAMFMAAMPRLARQPGKEH